MKPRANTESYLRELRLFLEEICCDLCRFSEASKHNVLPEEIRVTQESFLGAAHGYADILVQVSERTSYFVEVKFGYSYARTVASLIRKYRPGAELRGASKIIVVLDKAETPGWEQLASQVQSELGGGLEVEVWGEDAILAMLRESFDVAIDSISEQSVLEVRRAVDEAKGRYAFDDTWTGDEVQRSLLWNYGFWRLKQLRARHELDSRTIMPPGMYKNVAVIMADLCGFSSYVRDTRQDDIIRHCLTAFYAKARYEILNSGGMMYQFVGDEVIGLYGIPDQPDGCEEAALECARALLDIGSSVSHEWQRQIDRIQTSRGLHIGIAVGDIQVVSLRPFGRAHLGGIGEVMNLAARLLAQAGQSQIVVSNAYYQNLTSASRAAFGECQPIEAKNMGLIQAWKMQGN